MRVAGLGRILFGVSIAALGALGIGFHDFALVWQLVPKTIPAHDTLTILCGVNLFAGGISLLIPRTARLAALTLAGLLFVFLLVVRVPPLAAHPLIEGDWYGLSETLTFVAGCWTIFAMRPVRGGDAFAGLSNVRVGQILFGLALPAIGLSHFFYVDLTAPIVPAWLPFHVPLAYFTGAAHVAAGIAILLRVVPRLAATLEAVMASLFTLLVWVPTVIAHPTSGNDLTEIFVSLAITGTAWAVAESFRAR